MVTLLIKTESGSRVGWATYDNEAEAQTRSVEERIAGIAQVARGYDHGFCTPGQIEKHPDRDEWKVTTV